MWSARVNDPNAVGAMFRSGATASAPRGPMPASLSRSDPDGFHSMLRGLLDARGGDGVTSDGGDGGARQAAEQLVAITFVQPLLREARESNHAAAPFAPGAIEKQFAPLLDAQLSDRIVRASRWPLIDRVAHDMRGGEGSSAQGPKEGAGDVGSA